MFDDPDAVLIIGGRGEFGRFLQRDILPNLRVHTVLTIERDTPRNQHLPKLQQARHVVLATPLADYAERAAEIVDECRDLQRPTTLWLIPSVQAGGGRAKATHLAGKQKPNLYRRISAPQYGPKSIPA